MYRIQLLILAILMVNVVTEAKLRADWVDSFNNGFQQSWIFGNVNGLGGASPTFTSGIVNNTLRLADTNPAATAGAAVGFGFVNQSFSDVIATALVNPLGAADQNRDVGLAIRSNFATLSAYTMTVDFGTGEIDLSEALNGVTTALGNSTITITPTTPVVIEFSAVGQNLLGRVLTTGGAVLGSIQASDSSYSSGTVGVVVSSAAGPGPTSPLVGGWDNLNVQAVPEPTSLALIGMIALGCGCFQKWKQFPKRSVR